MLLVRCPACHHDQKYQPNGGPISEKKKRCVYCGRSFTVHANQERSRIVALA